MTAPFATPPEVPQRLRAQLAARAEREGVLDIAYRTLDTPVGPLLLAATEQGLLRVAYASEGHAAVLELLAETVSPRVLSAPQRLEAASGQGLSSAAAQTGKDRELQESPKARPFCDRQVVPTEGGLRGSLLHAVPVP